MQIVCTEKMSILFEIDAIFLVEAEKTTIRLFRFKKQFFQDKRTKVSCKKQQKSPDQLNY